MTRADRILAVAVLTAALAAWPLSAAARPGAAVVVSGPAGASRLPAGRDARLEVRGRAGVVIVRVEDGAARVERADCPDQVCVRSGTRRGGAIVCAPNGVVVRFEGGEDALDARSR